MASAERSVASAVEKLGFLLGQLIVTEVTFLRGVGDDVEWVRSELLWMECFLKDADAKGRKGDERMKNWVREVRDVACQAEDAVDNFMLRIERKRGATKELFRRYFCLPTDLIDLHGIGNEISRIRSQVNSISGRRVAYGIDNLSQSTAESSGPADERLQSRRQLSPRLHEDTTVVGFDVYKKLILERLLDSALQRRCVISVVGMGGLGKTTLAATIYKSNQVKSHFSSRIWISVSQEYRVHELLKSIVEQVMDDPKTTLKAMGLDWLKMELHRCLTMTKYLIVLDDVWDLVVWEQLRDAFPDETNGSRLLITTRFMDVARYADPWIAPYELPFLSKEESWELFLKVAFPSEQGVTPTCPQELMELGRRLVKRCGGLPLAVVVLGGLISVTAPTITAWQEVIERKDWEFSRQGKECLQILALSYNRLPHNLRLCFLYLGTFPENHHIKASHLIKLWIAEGFIPKMDNQTFEETARGYLDELVQRCMVQVVDRSLTYRKVKRLRIHDLFRNWCISEANEDCFFRICGSNTTDHDITSSRRLALHGQLGDKLSYSARNARAILGFNITLPEKILSSDIGERLKLLRVLYLEIPPHVELGKSRLPKGISTLIHLRNITLRSKKLLCLPSSIGKLHNLQTLDVRGTDISMLPKSLYKIQSLRHLHAPAAFRVRPSTIGSLRNLQTLEFIEGGRWIARDLPKLSNLRKLAISNVSEADVIALSDSLHKLNRIASLHLSGYQQPAALLFSSFLSQHHLYKLTLHNLTHIRQLPQNLIHLKLDGCELDQDGIAALERLPTLAILNLNCCGFPWEEMVFSAGGFPLLQNLQVTKFFGLHDWRIEIGAMPKLAYLKINSCFQLTMLPSGLEHVTSLQKLEMMRFENRMLRRLSSIGEERYKIRHIPFVMFDEKSLDLLLKRHFMDEDSADESLQANSVASTSRGLDHSKSDRVISYSADESLQADSVASTSRGLDRSKSDRVISSDGIEESISNV